MRMVVVGAAACDSGVVYVFSRAPAVSGLSVG